MANYPVSGTFNVLYPTRRKMAAILKKIIMSNGLFQEGTLVDSIRINAQVPALGDIEIEIIAMYYFIFLNNGADLWNGGRIEPYDLVRQFTQELDAAGITTEIYSQYTEWLTQKYPIMDVARIFEGQKSIVYSFTPIEAPAGFTPGFPLDV
jgi:hypothetical protein